MTEIISETEIELKLKLVPQKIIFKQKWNYF